MKRSRVLYICYIITSVERSRAKMLLCGGGGAVELLRLNLLPNQSDNKSGYTLRAKFEGPLSEH